ncbi:MAG: tetratricopeptide repeat protein, partial [Desulfosarcinaceae bacterium]
LSIDPGQEDARSTLEQLRSYIGKERGVSDPMELYEAAQEANEGGDKSKAGKLLERVLEYDPKFALAHNDLAVLRFEKGDKETAFRHYHEAAKLEPENSVFIKNLADFLYIEKGDLQAALQNYVQALTLDPEDIEALLATGHICMSLGKNDDAAVFFNRVLQIDPWNKDARELLNQPKSESSHSFAAYSDESLYERAQGEVSAGNRDLAIESLKKLIAQSPDYALAYNDLGVLLYELGDKEAALGYYEQASRLEPGNSTFLKNLADFYYIEMGRTQEALKLYVRILEKDSEDIDCLIAAGTICAHLDKREDARVFFERVLEIEPWNQQGANALRELGREGELPFAEDARRAAVR